MCNFGIGPEAALYFGQGVKRIVPVLPVGLGETAEFLVDPIFNTKEQVAASAGAVVELEQGVGFFNFGSNDFGNQRNYIVWGVLLSGSFSRDVGPLPLDVLFQRGDFRVVEGFEINGCP